MRACARRCGAGRVVSLVLGWPAPGAPPNPTSRNPRTGHRARGVYTHMRAAALVAITLASSAVVRRRGANDRHCISTHRARRRADRSRDPRTLDDRARRADVADTPVAVCASRLERPRLQASRSICRQGARVIGVQELARDHTNAWGVGPIAATTALKRYRDAGAPAVVEWLRRHRQRRTPRTSYRRDSNVASGNPTRVTLARSSCRRCPSLAIAARGADRCRRTSVDASRSRSLARCVHAETYAAVDAETSLLADTVVNDHGS